MIGIAKQRRSIGMTQKKLAESIGITPLAVAKWETKQTHPSIKNLKKMSQIFNCTIDELLKEE